MIVLHSNWHLQFRINDSCICVPVSLNVEVFVCICVCVCGCVPVRVDALVGVRVLA